MTLWLFNAAQHTIYSFCVFRQIEHFRLLAWEAFVAEVKVRNVKVFLHTQLCYVRGVVVYISWFLTYAVDGT
jgi:hypothetical protein